MLSILKRRVWTSAKSPPMRSAARQRTASRAAGVLLVGLALAVAACGQSPGAASSTPTTVSSHGWRLIASPNPPGPTPGQPMHSMLNAVSAASPSDIWAVGVSMVDDQGPQDLIEHWDGTAWHISPSPAIGGVLGAVVAVSSSDVWAVGGISKTSIFDSLPAKTQILHWNGTQWSIVASPDPGTKSNLLGSVTAIAANDVWAVGSFSRSDGIERPLIERWDGNAWRVIASPAPSGAGRSVLSAITRIPGTNQLWALGTTSTSRDPSVSEDQVLAERWDGSAWHLVTGPALPQGTQGCMLQGVVALSPTDAWAVGSYSTSGDQPPRPLIAHWDGTAWQMVSGLETEGWLQSVAALGPNDVRAVGGALTLSKGEGLRTLIMQWDGSGWKRVTSPSPIRSTSGESYLFGIAPDSADTFWAVGTAREDTGPAGVFRTIVEHSQ